MSKSAQENAYAERINRTIKEEFIIPMYIKDFKELQTKMKEIVWYYNNRRIHLNLKRLTPVEFEQKMEKQRNKYGILYI
jgi:transposase InsO family protein